MQSGAIESIATAFHDHELGALSPQDVTFRQKHPIDYGFMTSTLPQTCARLQASAFADAQSASSGEGRHLHGRNDDKLHDRIQASRAVLAFDVFRPGKRSPRLVRQRQYAGCGVFLHTHVRRLWLRRPRRRQVRGRRVASYSTRSVARSAGSGSGLGRTRSGRGGRLGQRRWM